MLVIVGGVGAAAELELPAGRISIIESVERGAFVMGSQLLEVVR